MSSVPSRSNLVAVASRAHEITLVDLKSGSKTHQLKGHKQGVLDVKWSPRNEHLLASGRSVFGINNSYKWIRCISCDIAMQHGQQSEVVGCASSARLSSHSRPTQWKSQLQHWARSLSPVSPPPLVLYVLLFSVNTAHNGSVCSLCFTSDGLSLVTFGRDQRLRVWNTSSGRNNMVNFGCIPNSSKKGVKIALSALTRPDICFVPSDNRIFVLNLESGELLLPLRGHYNRVNCCAFNADTQDLFSGGNDHCILTWTPQTDSELAYSKHLSEKLKSESKTKSFTKRTAASQLDNWSSDED